MRRNANASIAPPRVYLAGPEVFLPNPSDIGVRKKVICGAHGLEGVFPLDQHPDPVSDDPRDLADAVFQVCIHLMESCDLIIANLTPFRGISADIGTAMEVGYMFGQGKPVFAYSNEPSAYIERATAARPVEAGETIEDFGLADNLMCAVPARRSGIDVLRARSRAPLTDLGTFEACVAEVSAHLGSRR